MGGALDKSDTSRSNADSCRETGCSTACADSSNQRCNARIDILAFPNQSREAVHTEGLGHFLRLQFGLHIGGQREFLLLPAEHLKTHQFVVYLTVGTVE